MPFRVANKKTLLAGFLVFLLGSFFFGACASSPQNAEPKSANEANQPNSEGDSSGLKPVKPARKISGEAKNLEAANERKNIVLRRMADVGYITSAQCDSGRNKFVTHVQRSEREAGDAPRRAKVRALTVISKVRNGFAIRSLPPLRME